LKDKCDVHVVMITLYISLIPRRLEIMADTEMGDTMSGLW